MSALTREILASLLLLTTDTVSANNSYPFNIEITQRSDCGLMPLNLQSALAKKLFWRRVYSLYPFYRTEIFEKNASFLATELFLDTLEFLSWLRDHLNAKKSRVTAC